MRISVQGFGFRIQGLEFRACEVLGSESWLQNFLRRGDLANPLHVRRMGSLKPYMSHSRNS